MLQEGETPRLLQASGSGAGGPLRTEPEVPEDGLSWSGGADHKE